MQSLKDGLMRIVRENWFVILVIAGVLGVFLALRTPGSAVSSTSEVDALLQSGQPTLVEFYSNV
jgi:hypothetical protein